MGNTFKKFAETGYSSALKSIKCLIFFQICIRFCFNMYLLYYKINIRNHALSTFVNIQTCADLQSQKLQLNYRLWTVSTFILWYTIC